ncbi:MAG: ABC transporter ATP-binding protein [Candidatus Lokiarchaeota archaeon]|nr:ABC transporter ATP-binding protein [Candidatus Lokiarchaeota archaeon]
MNKSDKILLECDNISKQYGFFFALNNVSFNVKENSILGIVGANGAGKTTLIKILSGLSTPTSGKILINGLNYKENNRNIKQLIGTISSKSFLYEELSIYENLKFYSKLYSVYEKHEFKEKIEQYVDSFNLSDWIYEPISYLSTGMKQKVEIIRMLIHNPSLLLLDEPFSGLDFNSINLLIKILKDLRKDEKLTIILATHKIEVIQQISDAILILKRGKISKFAPKTEMDEIKIESYF